MEQNKVVNYISRDAKIGRNVKIWHFSYVRSNTEIGDNVSIGSLTHIDYNVKIGENTRIEGSVYIPPLTVIGKNVFIGTPADSLTNDPYPTSPRMAGVIFGGWNYNRRKSCNKTRDSSGKKQRCSNGSSSY